MLAWTPYSPKDKRLSSLDNRVSNLAVISMNFKKIKLPKIKELIGDSSCEISFKNKNSFLDKIEEINQVGQLSVHAGQTPVQCPACLDIRMSRVDRHSTCLDIGMSTVDIPMSNL